MFKKGLVVATAVASAMLLAGCASQGTGSACGEPTAVPAVAPAPVNTCKNMSSCKHKMKHHRHHRHHHAVTKKEASNTASTTTTTTSTGSTGSN